MDVHVKVELIDAATPAVRAARDAVGDAGLYKVVSRAAANLTVEHLEQLGRERHRPASPQNFYARAAASTYADPQGDAAQVRIQNEGIAQRYYGGRIAPSGRLSVATGLPITHIAIPVEGSPAEGHVPADFDDLFCIVFRGGTQAALARKAPAGDGKAKPEFLFWLRDYVDQDADDSVLPTDQAYFDAVLADVEAFAQFHRDDLAGGAPT